MTNSVGSSLCNTFDFVWARFMGRIEGLTDAEYRWEPVADCWSIHQDSEGLWRLDGTVGPAPDPAPITTIAWRLGHVVGLALGGFANWRFGDGMMSPQDVAVPPGAAEVPQFCEENYGLWRRGIAEVDDQEWWELLGDRWGPYAGSNTAELALHVLDELVHHAAEIGLLRDLFARLKA